MSKKTLFIGGIKSGKSHNAEQYILKNYHQKPLYLATTEFIDAQMHERIKEHKKNRAQNFITIEESLHLHDTISQTDKPILIECISMWINNMLYHELGYEEIVEEMNKIMQLDKEIVFVLNDVGSGIIPDNALAREFVDINGKISQLLASGCDAVYHNIAGIATKIK